MIKSIFSKESKYIKLLKEKISIHYIISKVCENVHTNKSLNDFVAGEEISVQWRNSDKKRN